MNMVHNFSFTPLIAVSYTHLDVYKRQEQYNRMLERYTKEASAMQQQIEMRENPNRGNIEPKLNYSINLINNIDCLLYTSRCV